MYDKERVGTVIEDIEKYLSILDKMELKKDCIDDVIYLASSMAIFTIINRVIDVASEICRGKGMGSPIEYKDLFETLYSGKVISRKRCDVLSDLIRMRNKFAHRYKEIDERNLLDGVEMMNEVRGFLNDVRKEVGKK